MSGGLMSCVRENSPPLDMEVAASGPLSLPEPRLNTSDLIDSSVYSTSQQNIMASTPLAAHAHNAHLDGRGGGTGGIGVASSTPQATPPNTEQPKRRRFHPLRNLRRIFRRRTITAETTAAATAAAAAAAASTDTPTSATLAVPAPTSSTSEKNLRSATLSSITSVASASSPSSPLTHQQLHDAYLTQSLPKSKSSYLSLLGGGGGHKNKSHDPTLSSSEGNKKSKHKHKQQQKHQQQQQHQQQQLQAKEFEVPEDETMYGTTTQTSATAYHHHHHHAMAATSSMTSTAMGAATKSSLLGQRQSIGVAVFPGAMNRNFFAERQKLRSVGDSSQDLDSGSGNDSGTGGGGHNSSIAKNNNSNSGGEMSDSQRSLSEGRLIDSDYSREGLSQSHDSVFSESATASSLSIVLKAELADVLRKRRNRPDASDEDLGLPRSPASPQRRAMAKMASGPSSLQTKSSPHCDPKQPGDMSSLSLLSMHSIDGEDMLASSTANNSTSATELLMERSRYSRTSTLSSISMTSADILRHRDSSSVSFDSKDEVDLFSNDWQRLSHSAARHKMAIRPNKKKGGPSRQHRRTLETSIPEANEDLSKLSHKKLTDIKDLDAKAKTRSLPPGVNAAHLLEEHQLSSSTIITKNNATATVSKDSNQVATTAANAAVTKVAKLSSTSATAVNPVTTTSVTSAHAASASSSTTNHSIFGFRPFSSKASAIYESKEATSDASQKLEVTNKPDAHPDSVTVEESSDSGFLRRLMHRNSKRSIAKANAGDEDVDGSSLMDVKQSEPKKCYVASASNAGGTQDVTKSEFSYISSKNESQTELMRDYNMDNRNVSTVSSYMASTASNNTKDFIKPDEFSTSKPKSGPAARQRYLPQNISNENIHKSTEDMMMMMMMTASPKESILPKSSVNDTFKSTSMIQEITKQQHQSSTPISSSPSKAEHHFEKKPKIVGLSAFQQKISRSNDSFARANSSSTNNSLTSLDQVAELELCAPVKVQIYEQKSRKSVEKSKSFRAYGEEKPAAPLVHNNMPSLPDLSLNLRVPYYKDFASQEREQLAKEHTDFQVQEDNERKSFSNYDLKTSPLTPTKPLVALKLLPSPLATTTNQTPSPYRNFAELESSVEASSRSSFVNVIRKSSNFSEISNEKLESTKNSIASNSGEKVRPSVLALKKEKSLSEDNVLNSPSTANVTLREKSLNKQNLMFTNSSGHIEPSAAKDLERKSAPQPLSTKANPGLRSNSTRRSSSVNEAVESNGKLPEFLKIQLNRVDPMRSSHSHVVLAKNVKESPALSIANYSREPSPEKDDDFRRLSSESVDINERSSPEMEKRFPMLYHEAVNKQPKLCIGLPPKSPLKKMALPSATATTTLPTTPTTPPTPTINERDGRQEVETHFKLPEPEVNSNSLSLQERRRLFMSDNKTKVDTRKEDIKYERKKSINEEYERTRKCIMKSESLENRETSPIAESAVILRKKSFASSSSHLSMNGNNMNNIINNNNNNSSNSNSNSNVGSTTGTPTDPTPELMKVFARRSLKVKDEDLDRIMASPNITSNNNNNNNNSSPCTVSAPQTLKKFTSSSNSSSISSTSCSSSVSASNPNVDSDKENQSASEEKLDKLTKKDSDQCITITKATAAQTHSSQHMATNGGTTTTNNSHHGQRNSLADFRHIPNKMQGAGLPLNNNNISNNNLSNNNINSPLNGNKSFLPPIKATGFRPVSMERNNNLNNTHVATSPAKMTTLERPSSIKLMGELMAPMLKTESLTKAAQPATQTAKATTTTTTMTKTTNITKTFERSATVSEFKGIHQRRAEWEQRAKEALK